MMDVEYVSTSIARNQENETKEEITRWNVNLPTYFYKEIPTVFELIGILLNVTILIYFIKSKRYQSPVFTILTSLAAMDTCVCLGGVLQIFTVPTVIAPEAGFLCGVTTFVVGLGLEGSEYHLMFFACLRLYQAIWPLRARASVTVGLMVKCCATIVVLSMGTAVLFATYWRSSSTLIDGEEVTVCFFTGDTVSKDITILVFFTIIPCGGLFLLHILKYFAYIRSKSVLENQQQGKQKSPDGRIMAIMIILFYMSLVPGFAYMIIQQKRIKDYAFTRDNVYLALLHVVFVNSIMNPLVYVLAMKSIRDDIIRLFCFTRKK